MRLTTEYTDQYITEPKNHSSARFTFLINKLSINFRLRSSQYTWSVYYQYSCKAQIEIELNLWVEADRAANPERLGGASTLDRSPLKFELNSHLSNLSSDSLRIPTRSHPTHGLVTKT